MSKRKKIYDVIIAHRGFHLKYPENTLPAINQALKQNLAVEIDVRQLKCGTIVCFHDRYMKRMLNVPGRIDKKTYDEIKRHKVNGSKYPVPTLKEALDIVNSQNVVLIQVCGEVTDKYLVNLSRIVDNYHGTLYFCCNNFASYLRLYNIWKKRVYYNFNPFRRRFSYLKGKDYKNVLYVPTIDNIIVTAEDSVKDAIKKIYKSFNLYNTRVKEGHWLLEYNGKKYQIQHRGILDSRLKEHSKEAFLRCKNAEKVIELDVARYDGHLVCYHSDSISSKLGQKTSISEKLDIASAMSFKEALKTIDSKVPIIVDIKDFSIFSRRLEDEIMEELKGYAGDYSCQSFNPLVLLHFKEKYPFVIRGQIGHSLNGLKKLRKVLLTIVNFVLFYASKPDYIVYDLDPYVHLLSKYNNILGLPVIGYTATSIDELNLYADFFDNIIVEGNFLDE